jgi:PAS domain-containing protein
LPYGSVPQDDQERDVFVTASVGVSYEWSPVDAASSRADPFVEIRAPKAIAPPPSSASFPRVFGLRRAELRPVRCDVRRAVAFMRSIACEPSASLRSLSRLTQRLLAHPVREAEEQPMELILARNLVSIVSLAAFLVDLDGHIVFYNDAVAEVIGSSFEETRALSREQWNARFGPFDEHGAPMKSTISAIRDRGTVASSSRVSGSRRESEGSVARRASSASLAASGDSAIRTDVAPSVAHACAICCRSRSITAGFPSCPKISSAPADVSSPICA